MANPFFGAITDVWKHLPLAEVLAREPPEFYWESHAGSADYGFTSSTERDYGVTHFLRNAEGFPHLAQSAYRDLLSRFQHQDGLVTYPGSPRVAMHVLPSARQLLFCDLDQESLATIDRAARELGFDEDRVLTAHGEGLGLVARAADLWESERLETLFAFIDPFDFYRTSGPTAFQLLARLAGRGARAMLWYYYYNDAQRQLLMEEIAVAFREAGQPPPWWGEIAPDPFPNPRFDFNQGCVRACGIACANLELPALELCRELGRELSASYSGSTLPGGAKGDVAFRHAPLA